jgi:hypothetical protein
MIESVFSKIYSYRERENKDSKENYLIEIFSHCLLTDKKLCADFLELLDLELVNDFSIKTQTIYDYGRPDLEINLLESKTCILIECKIEHFERENQLEDYKKILLEKNVRNRHLVYLTKYYEHRDNDNKQINFDLLKWSDIYNLIDNQNTPITKELKNYIKDENMAESKNFNYNDITSLMSITGTIRKMDEVLDSIKDYYEKTIGTLSKDSARSTRMKDSWYVTFHSVGKPNFKFSIDLGFIWWWDDVYLGVRIWLPRAAKYKDTEYYKQIFSKHLKDWEFEEQDNAYTFGNYKLLTQFIIDEDEQIPEMRNFLKICIDKLNTLKNADPKIFK